MVDSDSISQRFALLPPHLDERERRLFAAAEANGAGYGGIAAVARITGIAPSTIGRGRHDLAEDDRLDPGRIRRPGGGRKSLVATDAGLVPALLALVEPTAIEAPGAIARSPNVAGQPTPRGTAFQAMPMSIRVPGEKKAKI